jgi:site-specific DNA-methyltransferase (adenine-specific)
MTHAIIPGDCIEGMRTLSDESVHCCVTSPPYWGLRDYGHDGQIGLEATPEAYVARMVEVFREVRRVLRDDGTCWVNLGDSYNGIGGPGKQDGGPIGKTAAVAIEGTKGRRISTLKHKDLVGIPWRVAFALQADGWWLRQDIIWHKPNPMPESVRDRCTKAHEYVFLLTKGERYYYDAEAVSEKSINDGKVVRLSEKSLSKGQAAGRGVKPSGNGLADSVTVKPTRNRRSVWTITTKPYSGAHFAVMPRDLVEPCIKAGCPEGGTVLDPFAGSGTTLAVAAELGRNGIGCELNPEYIAMAEERIKKAVGRRPLLEAFA